MVIKWYFSGTPLFNSRLGFINPGLTLEACITLLFSWTLAFDGEFLRYTLHSRTRYGKSRLCHHEFSYGEGRHTSNDERLRKSAHFTRPILNGLDLRENLQETIDFPIKYCVFLHFSFKPIHWYPHFSATAVRQWYHEPRTRQCRCRRQGSQESAKPGFDPIWVMVRLEPCAYVCDIISYSCNYYCYYFCYCYYCYYYDCYHHYYHYCYHYCYYYYY